jgi:hypothetical protein
MSDDFEIGDYEVGYKKPPKSGQFTEGVSGNPSGRPKKVLGFGAQVTRELKSEVTITEQGKQVVVTKFEVVAKQAVNKAAKGNLQAIKLVTDLRQQELERNAEQQRLANRTAKELTTEELLAYLNTFSKKPSPNGEDS